MLSPRHLAIKGNTRRNPESSVPWVSASVSMLRLSEPSQPPAPGLLSSEHDCLRLSPLGKLLYL